jgi:hypothetical protein
VVQGERSGVAARDVGHLGWRFALFHGAVTVGFEPTEACTSHGFRVLRGD